MKSSTSDPRLDPEFQLLFIRISTDALKRLSFADKDDEERVIQAVISWFIAAENWGVDIQDLKQKSYYSRKTKIVSKTKLQLEE